MGCIDRKGRRDTLTGDRNGIPDTPTDRNGITDTLIADTVIAVE